MSIPRGASLESVLQTFEDPNFLAHVAVDMECGRKSLDEAYSGNAELMAQLDAYSQLLVGEMSRALADLQRSERRIKYQYELLKNDVDNLANQQSEVGAQISSTVHAGMNSEALILLRQLEDERKQIESVKLVLERAASLDAAAPVPQDLVGVFEGTCEESRVKKS